MIRKLTLVVGFGAGYVLGAKAGTERYDQIVAKARELAGMPAVQEFTSNVSQTASTVADKAKGTVSDAKDTVNDKVSSASGKTGSSGTGSGGTGSGGTGSGGSGSGGSGAGSSGASGTGLLDLPPTTTGADTGAPGAGVAASPTAPIRPATATAPSTTTPR